MKRAIVLLLVTSFIGAASGPAWGTSVAAGYDLFETAAGTSFAGFAFEGVPIGTFDFGGGPVVVGQTDTIVQRLAQADCPDPCIDVIPIELIMLQLVSSSPINLGAGVGNYYVTLQSARGGPASAGSMAINFFDPFGGVFDSQFNLFVDIRFGAANGPIVLSPMLQLIGTNIPWDRTAPTNALLIPGVNDQLCGSGNTLCDFWPGTPVGGPGSLKALTEVHPGVGNHEAQTSSGVPEPSTVVLVGLGSLGILSLVRHIDPRHR